MATQFAGSMSLHTRRTQLLKLVAMPRRVMTNIIRRFLSGLERALFADFPRVGQRNAPHTGQVEGGRCQGDFHRHFRQAPQSKAAQATLLFQHSEQGFDNRLPASIDGLPRGCARLLHHALMLGIPQRRCFPARPRFNSAAWQGSGT